MPDLSRPQLAATRLLDWFEANTGTWSSAATPLDLLIEHLNLDVLEFDPQTRHPGTLGWLEPGEALIFVRNDLSPSVRRFTLAHEVGHFVLHRGVHLTSLMEPADALSDETLNECDDEDVETPFDLVDEETLHSGQTYSARAQRETEANVFAATLLMPSERLMTRFLEIYAHVDNNTLRPGSRYTSIHKLAGEFGVSEDALLRRLGELLSASAINSNAPSPIFDGNGPTTKKSLDSWQLAAVEAQTPALVVAGPGTGKTSTLVARVAYLVHQQGVEPEHILALTFSNKAAQEMRERLETLLVDGSAKDSNDALALPHTPFVSTIHAFCADLLRRYGPLVGLRPDFRLVGETDGYFLLRQLTREMSLIHYQPINAPAMHFPALLAAISRAKDELVDPERYATVAQALLEGAKTPAEHEAVERALEVAQVYAAYQRALEARGDPDYGDLIRLAVRLLEEQPDALAEIRSRYQHIVVDEFQDINRAMGVLLHALAGEDGPLWAVGDADQAIYRFRGASPANLSRFTSEYPNAHVYTLRRNYRSAPDILEAAAALASAALPGGERAPLEAERLATQRSAITLATAQDEKTELHGLASAIKRRLRDGRSLRDQVVLCRTRRQCQRVAAALQSDGISVALAVPLLEQEMIKDLLAVIALLAEPSGMGLLRAGNLPDHAFTHADARAILATAQSLHIAPVTLLSRISDGDDTLAVSPESQEGLVTLAEVLRELRQAPDIATGLARYIFGLTRWGARLMMDSARGDEDAITYSRHIAQLMTLARSFEDHRRATLMESADVSDELSVLGSVSRYPDWAGFLDYVRVVMVLRQDVSSSDDTKIADEVRVLTVHGSKGLEFPIVYLPGMANQRFPAQVRWNSAPLLPGLSEDETLETGEMSAHLAEESCLFYVALTRARDELILSHAERYGRRAYSESPFLAPIITRMDDRLRRERWMPDREIPDREIEVVETENKHAIPTHSEITTANEPLRLSAIETYDRCPRQYAYRYVYGLRSHEAGLALLRRTLHETLNTFQYTDEGNNITPTQSLSLQEAWDAFEQRWIAAVGNDLADSTMTKRMSAVGEHAAPPQTTMREDNFEEVYRRHGRAVIERAWTRLTQPSLPFDAASPGGDPISSVTTRYDEPVTVRLGEHEIAITVDRVERRALSEKQPKEGRSRQNPISKGENQILQEGVEAHFVRHGLGRNLPKPDLRALLYQMAAEQTVQVKSTMLYQHNLTTGEMEPIALTSRKLASLRKDLEMLLDEMQRGNYPPRPDPFTCPTCPFLLICPG